MELKNQVRNKVTSLKQDKNILGIFIAGSFARNELHSESDVDLFALVRRPRPSQTHDPYQKLKVGFYTERQLRSRFDALDWIFARPLLLHGKIVYDPKKILRKLKKEIRPYPEDIRQYELRSNVQHARMQLARANYALKESDLSSTAYFARRCAEEILYYYYVLNKIYLPSERKFWSYSKKIRKGKENVSALLKVAFPPADAKALAYSLTQLSKLCRQIETDYSKRSKNWKPNYLKVAKNWF